MNNDRTGGGNRSVGGIMVGLVKLNILWADDVKRGRAKHSAGRVMIG